MGSSSTNVFPAGMPDELRELHMFTSGEPSSGALPLMIPLGELQKRGELRMLALGKPPHAAHLNMFPLCELRELHELCILASWAANPQLISSYSLWVSCES